MRSKIRSGTILCLMMFLSFTSTLLPAQTHTPKTVNIIAKCKGYYEYLPVNYSVGQTRYPIIFYIHGGASYGNGSSGQLANLLRYEGIPYYITQNKFPTTFNVNGQNTSFIIITPQFSSKPSAAEVKQVIDYIVPRYRVDTTRIYLTGYSVGGDVAWKQPNNLAAAYRLAAIAPVAGYNNPYSDATAPHIAGSGLPVWAIHSNSDATINVSASQNMVNKINSLAPGVPAIITRLNNVTHDNTVLAAYDPQFRPNGKSMYEWFLGYSRNFPPVARAGNDVSITMPVNSVSLNGNNSSDPENTPLLYKWQYLTGPSRFSISNETSSTPTISNLVAGIYTFRLTVTDQALLVSSDTVRVTVVNPNPNQPPTAIAEGPQEIYLPLSAISVNGLQSTDTDGSIETYGWTKIEGPSSYNIEHPNQATTTISSLKVGTYRFRLTVTDNQGGASSDTITIRVINPFPNFIPVARAGADQTITNPVSSVSVSGSASTDTDGSIVSYQWRQLYGRSAASISNSTNVNTTISSLQPGTYSFELKVTDDSTASHRDTILITVNPAIKTIQVNLFGGSNGAGSGWTNWNVLTSLNSPSLPYSTGGASGVTASLSQNTGVGDNGTNYPTSMCPPAVGRHASYSNTNRTLTISGLDNNKRYNFEAYASRAGGFATRFTIGTTTVTITTNNNYTSKAAFTNLVPVSGRITISIGLVSTYTYLNGFTLTEIASPPTANQPPVSRPGNAVSVNLPNSVVTLNGNASSDPDGNIISYLWQKISGPTAVILTPAQSSTDISGLNAGEYIFQLTVTDNGEMSASEFIEVNVTNAPAGPLPPVAKAGSDLSFKLPQDSITVDGSLSVDPDGVIVSYLWKKVSGPLLFAIADTAGISTKIRNLEPGQYIFELTVTDTSGLMSKDSLTVNVLLPNNPPVAQAGADMQLTLPLNSLQLDGTASDTDGTISGFKWTKSDGPATFSISDSTISNPILSGLTTGVYKMILTVSDNDGASGSDTLLIIVNNAPNRTPVANAGEDQFLKLPVDSTTVTASASLDSDGTIQLYEWNQVSGPALATVVSPGSVSTGLRNLVVGTYAFSVSVTDDSSATDIDTVTIVVRELNQPPVASAGENAYLVLPVNSITLSAAASADEDGSVSSYAWTKISGPSSYNITGNNLPRPQVVNLVAGTYLFRVLVTDNYGGTDDDTVEITVYPPLNLPPTARAGNDQIITLPVSSVNITGIASGDADGSLVSYLWSKSAGPAGGTIVSPSAVATTINNLQAGTYNFVLQVFDDSMAIDTDTIVITVRSAVPVQRRIKVNLFSGSSPAPSDWNNWNVLSGLSISSLKYEDGANSAASAALSNNTNVGDNGNTYPITMCPVSVGRFASYSTSNRTLTIQGLDNDKRYDFEGYSSRTGGTPTKYTIGTASVTINTDRNYSNKASFTNIAPVSGRIVIQMDKVTTWSYLNGFILTENTVSTGVNSTDNISTTPGSQVVTLNGDNPPLPNNPGDPASSSFNRNNEGNLILSDSILVAPNPFGFKTNIGFSNDISGKVEIALLNDRGQIIKQWIDFKTARRFSRVVETGYVARGLYLIIIKMNGWQRSTKVIRY